MSTYASIKSTKVVNKINLTGAFSGSGPVHETILYTVPANSYLIANFGALAGSRTSGSANITVSLLAGGSVVFVNDQAMSGSNLPPKQGPTQMYFGPGEVVKLRLTTLILNNANYSIQGAGVLFENT